MSRAFIVRREVEQRLEVIPEPGQIIMGDPRAFAPLEPQPEEQDAQALLFAAGVTAYYPAEFA